MDETKPTVPYVPPFDFDQGRPIVLPPSAPAFVNPTVSSPRLVSLDAYRGFIMLLLATSAFRIPDVARHFKGDGVWDFLAYQFNHAAWRGCSFWDLIQPSFMFMVGVAIPYSYASRKAKGDSEGKILAHTIWRSLILVLLGVFLSSNGERRTHWTFVNVLSQIGLGYTFVYLFRERGFKVQFAALVAILGGTWAWFALSAPPPPDFDYAAVGVRDAKEMFAGFAAHWNMNANPAHRADLWLLNLFPPHEFTHNRGGYATLNFVPSMATMLMGLMAGDLLRGPRLPKYKFQLLLAGGAACFGLGALADPVILPGVSEAWVACPIVKRIWTPSFALLSTGWTLWMLAAFFFLVDIKGWKKWAFPFVVVGMNSIAMYCMWQLFKGWVMQSVQTHFGRALYEGTYGPIFASLTWTLVLWLICLWMYRRKVFLRI